MGITLSAAEQLECLARGDTGIIATLRLDPAEPMLAWDNSRIRLRSA